MPNKLSKFEAMVNEFLSPEQAALALDLYAFLKENGFKLKWTSQPKGREPGGRGWVCHGDKQICIIKMRGKNWWTGLFKGYSDEQFALLDDHMDDDLRAYFHTHYYKVWCEGCGNQGRERHVFGKTINDLCACSPLTTHKADEKMLGYVKRYILVLSKFMEEA